MRTIKFRGKNIETCEWVYGFYTQGGYIREDGTLKVRHIIHSDFLYDVQEETVGQFTGLYDYNEKEIYEGDILRYIQWENNEEVLYYITFEEEMGSFVLQKPTLKRKVNISQLAIEGLKIEVIGNIHDNPELLKGE